MNLPGNFSPVAGLINGGNSGEEFCAMALAQSNSASKTDLAFIRVPYSGPDAGRGA
jgi:hypothetical protein